MSSKAVTDSVQGWSYTPFVVWRRANLPFAELLPLTLPQTWNLLDELQKQLEKCRNHVLVDALHHAIPRAAPEQRKWLLSLKRDIFNGRPPKGPDMEAARRLLPGDILTLLDGVLAAHESKEALLLQATPVLEREMREALEVLKKLAARDDFVRGIQLSGRSFRHNLRSFSTLSGQSEFPAGLRKTRETIISYLSRMALKPSPFGAFTEVGADHWNSAPGDNAQEEGGRISVSHLSRAVTSWLQALMLGLDEYREIFPLWLNNTVEERDSRVEFFTRGEDQNEQVFGGERLVSFQITPPLKLVIDALRGEKLNRKQLVEQLDKRGIRPEQGRTFVEKLIAIGLLERGFGFADQEPRYLRRMVEFLAELPGESSRRCVSLLTRLAEIEETFSEATTQAREAMLYEMDTHFRDLAVQLGSDQSPDSEDMAQLFEDYGSSAPSGSWQSSLIEEELPRFALLSELLPVFDDACIERAGLYAYYESQHGKEKEIDFLEFYHAFSMQGPDQVSAIMRGLNTPFLPALQEFKAKFWTRITDLLNQKPDASVLDLDDNLIRELVRQSPASQLWQSASFRVQFSTTRQPALVVLNGIGPGHTSRFSRFCAFLHQNNGNSGCLHDWVKHHFLSNAGSEQRADLSAVLNINTNLHPPIAELELEYPRCRANKGVEVLTLRDLYVAPAPDKKELRLYRKKNRRQIELVSLNFLHPVAGPPLYRFLHLFTPFVNYRHRLWRFYDEAQGRESKQVYYPRLTSGPVVLDRRTWMYGVERLERIDVNVDNMGTASLLTVDKWRRQLGLPAECFFSLNPVDAPRAQPANWTQAVLEWTRRTKEMRRRKPHYVDFRNPFQVSILLKGISRMSAGTVIFQECLPATEEYLNGQKPHSAEEFIIEINRSQAR